MEQLTLKRLYEHSRAEMADKIIPKNLKSKAFDQHEELVSSDSLMLKLLENTEGNLYILSVEAAMGTDIFDYALAFAPNGEVLLAQDPDDEIFGLILFVQDLIRGELKRNAPLEKKEISLIRNVLRTNILGLEGPKLEKVYAVERRLELQDVKTKLRTLKKTLNPFAESSLLVRRAFAGERFAQLLEQRLEANHFMFYSAPRSYLLFCFDDGEVVEAGELFCHPYAFFLNEKNINFQVLQNTKLEKRKYILSGEGSSFYGVGKDLKFLNLILYGVLEAGGIPVGLGNLPYADNETFNVETFEVHTVDSLGSENYSWSLNGMSLLMQEKVDKSLIQAFGNWLYNIGEKKLFQSLKAPQIELYRDTLKSGGGYISPWDISTLDATKGLELELRDSAYLLKELREFQAKLKKKFSIELDLNEVDQAQKEVVLPRFEYCHDEKSLQIAFYDQKREEVEDIPNVFLNCFEALQNGIGGLRHERNTDMASRSRGTKRERDLKFLRHAGTFASMLNLCLNALKEEKALIKKDSNRIQTELVSFFLSLDKNEESFDKPVFSKCFSSRVSSLARNTLASLLDTGSYECAFFDESGWKIYSFKQSFIETFSMILNYCGRETQGQFYSKQRFKDISVKRDYSTGEISINFKNSSQLLQRIVQAAVDPLAVTVNGQQIQKLTKDDLKIVFGVNENHDNGWFELHPQVFFQGQRLSDEQACEFIGEDEVVYFKNAFYLLDKTEIPSVDWLQYFWEKLQGEPKRKSKFNERHRRMQKRSIILELFALVLSGEEVSDFAGLEKEVNSFLKLVQGETFTNPALIQDVIDRKYSLKSFQREGLEWLIGLSELGLGGILADDMGLGKTIQALAFLSYLKKSKGLGLCLIIVPTSLLYNWQSEAQKFTPDLAVNVCETGRELKCAFLNPKNDGVFITTYGLFHRHAELILNCQFDRVIFDEAQVLKNAGTQKSELADQLIAQQKICLTGTPLENHLGEFYTLINLCVPGALGDFDSFAQTYALGQSQKTVSKQAMSALKKKVRPLVLRRSKESVIKDLPGKSETVIQIPFTQQQKKIYKDVALSYNNIIQQKINEGQDNHQLEMLTALLRLRQICTSPELLPGDQKYVESPKIDALIPKLHEVYELGQSSLVFTNFKTSLFLLEERLKAIGLGPRIISGDIPAKKRKTIVKEFIESTAPEILLMTLKTGGVGLNLTKASYVFHLEPWWNPAAENQGTDRAYRIGQRKNVSVYRYLMKDSVEQRIQDLKLHKSKIFNALFSEDEEEILKDAPSSTSRSLSLEDFRYLLSTT